MNSKISDFQARCYELLQQVPRGKVTTYSEIARALGTTACRAVGTAMAKNRDLQTIPCYRVVKSDGDIGEYALGRETKAGLLLDDGVIVRRGRIADLDSYLYRFDT